jgi:hypothetical protein
LLFRREGLETTFACSDHGLLKAAAAEGLAIFDPVQMEAEIAPRFVPPPHAAE